jgi:two-component system alkaline phosphatase synthesis response regulator PhoP
LFYLLASKPGKVFKRDEILDKVWDNKLVVGGRTIDVRIRNFIEKIGERIGETIKELDTSSKYNHITIS